MASDFGQIWNVICIVLSRYSRCPLICLSRLSLYFVDPVLGLNIHIRSALSDSVSLSTGITHVLLSGNTQPWYVALFLRVEPKIHCGIQHRVLSFPSSDRTSQSVSSHAILQLMHFRQS